MMRSPLTAGTIYLTCEGTYPHLQADHCHQSTTSGFIDLQLHTQAVPRTLGKELSWHRALTQSLQLLSAFLPNLCYQGTSCLVPVQPPTMCPCMLSPVVAPFPSRIGALGQCDDSASKGSCPQATNLNLIPRTQ